MSKYNILYFTKNMDSYTGASYQREILNAMKYQFNVYLYGPGYKIYDINDNFNEIIKKFNKDIKAVIFGHSYLSDELNSKQIQNFCKFDFKDVDLPKVGILNKEYVNLDKKLEFFKKNSFDLCFTHNHMAQEYSKLTNIKFVLWPFAVSPSFTENIKDKVFDVGFSGILQNTNHTHSDLRHRVMNKIFYSILGIPLIKKREFKNHRIFWNAKPSNFLSKVINRLFKFHIHLNDKNYEDLLKKSKIFINTLSPADLVSPRFYECMASKTLVLCEKSDIYKKFFPEGTYVEFDNEETIIDIINHYLEDSESLEKITTKAQEFIYENHYWTNRIDKFKSELDLLITL